MDNCSRENTNLVGFNVVQSPSSSTTSLETLRSHRHGILRRSHVGTDESSESGSSDRRMSVRFVSNANLRHRTSSTSTSRLSRCLRRSLKEGEFPLGDVNIDKSTASQAVAFVIRASRRGVVPLCAAVADLLKEKNTLEETIEEQKEEILELMQNQAVPRSPAPPPPEMKDFSLQTVQEMHSQTTSVQHCSIQTDTVVLSCNRSRILNEDESPEPPEPTDMTGISFDCGSKFSIKCLCPKTSTSSTQNPQRCTAGVNTTDEDRFHSDLGYFEHRELEHVHKALKHDYKQQMTKTEEATKRNEMLSRDLEKTKEEIVSLQKAIQELQTNEYERLQEEERLKLEETYSVDVQDDNVSGAEVTEMQPVSDVIVDAEDKLVLPVVSVGEDKSGSTPFRSSLFPGPILGCKCHMCRSFFRSSGLLGFACSPYVTDSSGRNPVLRDLRKLVSLQNSKLQLRQNDQVLIRNNKLGVVKYVGHLDGVGTPSVVYVGVELERPDGRHDGYLYGKRYFFCPQDHGLFLPLQDVLCVVNRKLALPSLHQRHHPSVPPKSSIRKVTSQSRHRKVSRKSSPSISSNSSDCSTDERRLPAVASR